MVKRKDTERQVMTESEDTEPRYVISVAARMVGLKVHTLRYYEKSGIIRPARSQGRTRLYSEQDIALLGYMRSLMEDLGINLAGAEVVLRMSMHMRQLRRRIEELESEVKKLVEEEQ